MAKAGWGSDWKVGVRVWIDRDGQTVLGEGRAELLAAIASEHSITKAAKLAGMSYRRAWNMIQEINAAASDPLVEAAV
ncbi:MAG TPA: LysR family transcriptional regulator, partial [Lacipirellulaceae bacterium]|nr:LysR family transcriptional regulator [Lacipirellulaceae bacterium]